MLLVRIRFHKSLMKSNSGMPLLITIS